MDSPAILPDANRSEVLHALAALHPLDNVGLLLQALRRYQHLDRVPDRLVRPVSEQALRSTIPAHDTSIQVPADNRIFGRFHNRCQEMRVLFRPLAFTYVTEAANQTRRAASQGQTIHAPFVIFRVLSIQPSLRAFPDSPELTCRQRAAEDSHHFIHVGLRPDLANCVRENAIDQTSRRRTERLNCRPISLTEPKILIKYENSERNLIQ